MRETKKAEGQEAVLVFCAHSDDQIFGVGGTLAKYAKEGKYIYTVVFSFGETTHPWLKGEVAADMRVKEAKAADKVIGGSGVDFLGLKEGKFNEEFREKKMSVFTKGIINKLKPKKIFMHSAEDPHPDHKAVYKLILKTLDEMGYKCEVYSFDVWNPFKLRKSSKARLYVDITETFNTKLKALAEFRSQFVAMLTLKWSVYIRAWNEGVHNDCKYAESFIKVR
ncbi:PIG-L family deacetylase [Candidatus Woesearchaeota archaeon]|nr:PIG-L family deacetylase [Candidatus Woesearchaeota archaeon]